MMLKRQVLQSFKSLHKTRKTIFKGDTLALERARLKINEEYKKNKNIQNDQIEQKILFANEVENELRKNVIQAIEVEPGKYKACITEETLKLDNIPYKYNSCEGSINKS